MKNGTMIPLARFQELLAQRDKLRATFNLLEEDASNALRLIDDALDLARQFADRCRQQDEVISERQDMIRERDTLIRRQHQLLLKQEQALGETQAKTEYQTLPRLVS